jgi:hypothetical protein
VTSDEIEAERRRVRRLLAPVYSPPVQKPSRPVDEPPQSPQPPPKPVQPLQPGETFTTSREDIQRLIDLQRAGSSADNRTERAASADSQEAEDDRTVAP